MTPAQRAQTLHDVRVMQVKNARRRGDVEHAYEVILWDTAWLIALQQDREREAARVAAARHASSSPPPTPAVPVPAATPSGWGPCGGVYPPCSVVAHESATAGLYSAFNPSGCGGAGCYGKWQFSGEWAGKLGLPADLSQATPAQQDEAARLLWANGAGCSNWAAC